VSCAIVSAAAIVTLPDCACVRIDIDGVIGAGSHAGLAADTTVTREIDDAVLPPPEHLDRTDIDAERVVAVVAAPPELLIAATALEHGLILVTRNTWDFARIPKLQRYESASSGSR
jgi:hypothetical protein